MSTPYVQANSWAYNTVVAATLVSWDYCLTVGEEVDYIWRRKWTRVTYLFAIIRYVPIIYSYLIMANNIVQFVPTSHATCIAWLVCTTIVSLALVICFEILLVMRVLALYGRNRLMRNGLMALLLCVDIIRVIIIAIAVTQFRYERYVYSSIHLECHITKYPSVNPSGAYIVGIVPDALLVCLAIIKLVQAKRTHNIPVSKLLAVMVRDDTWASIPIFVFSTWNIFQYELAPQNGDIGRVWIAPVLGFIGSRSILNLRSEAHTPPGGTNVETWEISLPPIEPGAPAHDLS